MNEERIVVAVDASPHSLAALRAAAQFAATIQAELYALFVEDSDLLSVSNLPFWQEIGSFSATARQLDRQTVERLLRARASKVQAALAQLADQMQVQWSFQVTRGGVTNELLAAAENAMLFSIGRASRVSNRRLGSTTELVIKRSGRPVLILDDKGQIRHPLTLLYTGTESAERAFQLAIRLAQRDHDELHILLWMDATQVEEAKASLAQRLAEQNIRPHFTTLENFVTPQSAIRRFRMDTLILPVEQVDLLGALKGPVLLVP
ncbi:MAG: universal stress protein [Caldilineaceae bacterium]